MMTEAKISIPSRLKQKSACALESSFLHDELQTRLVDKLLDHKKNFTKMLTIGTSSRFTYPKMEPTNAVHAPTLPDALEDKSCDLILANLCLNVSENPRDDFLKIGKALEGDGLLVASIIGSESFAELRYALERTSQRYQHISPLPSLTGVGSLLQSLKFALPVIDRDTITLHYASLPDLLREMKSLGSINFHPMRNKGLTGKNFWGKVAQNYPTLKKDGQTVYPLSLEILYIHALRPHKSQQQPLSPSRAYIPLAEVSKG